MSTAQHQQVSPSMPIGANVNITNTAIIPPKPSRPFTEYNVFFQLEREYILQSDGQGCLSKKPLTIDPNTASRPLRYRALVLPSKWYVVGQCRDKKRKHRKSHGTISFVDLTKTISKAWGTVDKETKAFCKCMADGELKRYRSDMKMYIAEYGEEAARGKRSKSKSVTVSKPSMATPPPSTSTIVTPPTQPKPSMTMQSHYLRREMLAREMREMDEMEGRFEMRRNTNTNTNMNMNMNMSRVHSPVHSPVYSSNASAQVDVRAMMNRVAELEGLEKEIDYGLRNTTAEVAYSDSFDFHATSRPMKRPRVVSPRQQSMTSFRCPSYGQPDYRRGNIMSSRRMTESRHQRQHQHQHQHQHQLPVLEIEPEDRQAFEAEVDMVLAGMEKDGVLPTACESSHDIHHEAAMHEACMQETINIDVGSDTNDNDDHEEDEDENSCCDENDRDGPISHDIEDVANVFDDDADCDMLWNALAGGTEASKASSPSAVKQEEESVPTFNNDTFAAEYLEKMHAKCGRKNANNVKVESLACQA